MCVAFVELPSLSRHAVLASTPCIGAIQSTEQHVEVRCQKSVVRWIVNVDVWSCVDGVIVVGLARAGYGWR